MVNTKEDLIYACRAMESLMKAGISFEAALKEIVMSDYGEVSTEFKVLMEEAKTIGLEKALENLGSRNKSFKNFCQEMIQAVGIGNFAKTVRSIADSGFEELKTRYLAASKKVDFLLNVFAVLVFVVPISIMVVYSLFQSLATLPFDAAPIDSSMLNILNILFYVNVASIFALVAYSKISTR